MASAYDRSQVLRATLCEVERGLFHVSYHTDDADSVAKELPAYETGACPSDVMQRIEAGAKGYGFEAVIWDYELRLGPTDETAGVMPVDPPVGARGRRGRGVNRRGAIGAAASQASR